MAPEYVAHFSDITSIDLQELLFGIKVDDSGASGA